MQYDFDKSCHSVFALQHHLMIVVKYRKKVFDKLEIVKRLKTKTKEISNTFEVEIRDQECDLDYIPMIFKTRPTRDIP
jgi:putative transposase